MGQEVIAQRRLSAPVSLSKKRRNTLLHSSFIPGRTPHMKDETLQDVRNRIEAKYRAAIAGLGAIAEFLGESEPTASPSAMLSAVTQNGSSIRSCVLGVMDGSTWQTIAGLASKSGVAGASVRGVVYAPGLQDRISKQKKGKTVRFKLKKGGE